MRAAAPSVRISLQGLEDQVAGCRIEIASGFVGQNHARMVGGGAGNSDALLFAAGEFGRAMGGARGDAEHIEQFHGARIGVGRRLAGDQLRHGYVFERREFGQQVVELVDVTDRVATELGAAAITQFAGLVADNFDLAFLRAFEKAAEMQQGRLAGPRRRDKGDEFTAFDDEVGLIEHANLGCAFAIVTMDAGETQGTDYS